MRRDVSPNFLEYIPTADPTRPAVVAALRRYASRAHVDEFIPDSLEERAQDLVRAGRPHLEAYVKVLCWTYTLDSWPFEHVNRALREDSETRLQSLAPYICAMIGIFNPALRAAADLRLFRRTKLNAKQLAEYEPGSGLRRLGFVFHPNSFQYLIVYP